ncbi:hypothetical protein QCE62_05695 [Caballeronia sp. LZ033]|uniref:hypothetical protein n=1 Tax=Caballeronia sp. LZ033 TaxID=3038566 RepID=UPI002858FFDE|nr:hypothetical protein [Caballeronia sp. LZ033]MDR5813083.1 hypothetical protein [Caballeronia sp. LZ033]
MSTFWKHPATVGIAYPLFVAAVSAIASFYIPSLAPMARMIVTLIHFLATDVTLPRWVFWIWLVATVGAIGFVAYMWWDVKRDEASTIPTRYESDILFGLRWRWRITAFGWDDFTAFCPSCDNQLTMNDFQPLITGGSTYVCDSCGRPGRMDEHFIQETAKRAEKEAQRRYRTGGWKDAQKRIEQAK